MDADPLSDPEERRILYAALDSFRQYRRAAHFNITHLRRQSFLALPASHVDLLSKPPFSLPKTFDAVDRTIDSNADISEAILAVGLPAFGLAAEDEGWKNHAKPGDLDKARSTIRQLYRDWSAEGLPERHASYASIVNALETEYSATIAAKRHQCRVLVPGAGLGRLVFDICAAGFTVEGNEISYHQLLASHYILNCMRAAGQHTLYPWALGFSNHVERANQLKGVAVPDIHPPSILAEADATHSAEVHFSERMSMSSGDFCVVYRSPEYEDSFDAVTTCFFIDTAPNVINYIETIRHCLKPGGLWINVGPLLWHFESWPTPAERAERRKAHDSSEPHGDQGIGEPGSVELSHDEMVALIAHYGFEILKGEETSASATGYIQDPRSMLQNVYRPVLWTARKL